MRKKAYIQKYKFEDGFTYLSLLFIIVVMGIALSGAGQVWSTIAKKEKEAELLFRGNEFIKAIGMFHNSTPGVKVYPRDLQSLLADPRFPVIKRYLRKIYNDPMTGKPDWELIKIQDGSIIGIKSRSDERPLKKNFSQEFKGFEGKLKYSEWEFIYMPEKSYLQKNESK
jgi:type II secretory pathway pseudopilin PulG